MRLAILLCLLALAGVTHAQPWADGVSEPQKAQAQKLLEEGNVLFLAQNYKDALEKYQTAIRSWDHPAIRFNIVRCLIQLDKPVDASDNLQAALRYGADPLDDNVYREALTYQKLLAKQIAEIEISCNQDGAKVSLDGVHLMACPNTQKRRVAPGKHGIVASKDGYLPKEIELVVVGGNQERADIRLVPLAAAARIEHRWPGWIPWVVFGGGLAIGGVGGMLEAFARGDMADYDRDIARECPNGCPDEVIAANGWARNRRNAERLDTIALGVVSVGVATTTLGAVLLYMNRGRTVYAERIDVAPRDGGAVITLGGSF